MKTIIIGAGAAGLAAAHTLRKDGAEILCLEASDRAGGRTYSEQRDGYILDYGAQFLTSIHWNYLNLISELGLEKELSPFPFHVGIPRTGDNKITSVCFTMKLAEQLKHIKELITFRGVPVQAYVQMLPLIMQMLRKRKHLCLTDFEGILDLDTISAADYTLKRGGHKALEHVMQPVCNSMTLGEPEEISASYSLTLLWYCLSSYLFTLNCGFGSVSRHLYEQNKEHIHLSTPVKKIIIEQGKVKGVETPAGFIEADNVICTTTATTTLKLIPDLPDTLSTPLKKVSYSVCCHAMLALHQNLLPPTWWGVVNPRCFGSNIAVFSDNSIKSPFYSPRNAGILSCYVSGAQGQAFNKMADDEITRLLIKELQKWVPTMPEEIVFSEICRYDEAVCLAQPGMLTAISHMKKHHYQDVKGLYLAGEYMYMPACESATTSGIDAARAIMRNN